MKERPILFSGLMIRAILEDRKTHTRRVCKQALGLPSSVYLSRDAASPSGLSLCGGSIDDVLLSCPYGVPGDRLWVRETFSLCDAHVTEPPPVAYKATYDGFNMESVRWRPSIYMPRWASRITLEVTYVRVQRVQEISEEDAIAEGRDRKVMYVCSSGFAGEPCCRNDFANLWNDINAKRGYGWAVNPWVWAITFRRVQ